MWPPLVSYNSTNLGTQPIPLVTIDSAPRTGCEGFLDIGPIVASPPDVSVYPVVMTFTLYAFLGTIKVLQATRILTFTDFTTPGLTTMYSLFRVEGVGAEKWEVEGKYSSAANAGSLPLNVGMVAYGV